jgi:arginase family enzyme
VDRENLYALSMTFDPDAAAGAGSGIYGLPFTAEEARVVVIPVPYEATTSYGGGASRGPEAVFEASKQVDLFDRETGRPYESGIAMLDIPKTIADWNAKAKGIAAAVIEKGGVVDDATRHAASEVNLSWDIDGLDPTLCPSTGTPVPGGLSWNEAIGLLRALRRAGKRIVGLDLCEVSPGESEWDANVGARLLYKMIGFALMTR